MSISRNPLINMHKWVRCQELLYFVRSTNAWLKGLSPKENREVPPLRYDLVYRLKADFPAPRLQ